MVTGLASCAHAIWPVEKRPAMVTTAARKERNIGHFLHDGWTLTRGILVVFRPRGPSFLSGSLSADMLIAAGRWTSSLGKKCPGSDIRMPLRRVRLRMPEPKGTLLQT